jgi:hypothetical protein
MTKPMITLHDTQTNEVIYREMNNQEFAQYKLDQIQMKAIEAEAQAKAEAKTAAQAKLAALGLTVEDLTALGL